MAAEEDASPFRQICNLGIDPQVAKQALAANNNNLAAAIEWCFDGSFALETMSAAVNADGHDTWKVVRRKLHIEKVPVSAIHFLQGLQLARYVLEGNQQGIAEYVSAGESQPLNEDAKSFLEDCFANGVTAVLNLNGCVPKEIDRDRTDVMVETVYVVLTALHHGWTKFVGVIQTVLNAHNEWWTEDFTRKYNETSNSVVPGYDHACEEVRSAIRHVGLPNLVLGKVTELLQSGSVREQELRSVLSLLRFVFSNHEIVENEELDRLMHIFFHTGQQVLVTVQARLLDELLKLFDLLPVECELRRQHIKRVCKEVYEFFMSKTAANAKQIDTHAFDCAAEVLEHLTQKKWRDLYVMWLHMACICWRSESLEKRLYALQTINNLATQKVNCTQFIPGPQIGAEYQMNRKSDDCRAFRVVRIADSRYNFYDIEYVDRPGEILPSEQITFDRTVGETVLVPCELSVEDFHKWICEEQIFEQLFGSHLHAQLLANQGCEFVIYMSANGLLTRERAEWMVNKVTMMHGSEKRSMYGLVLRAFAQLQSGSQVSLLQAVACLKPEDAAAMLTTCSALWWEKHVHASVAVASHLQMILWKLIGNCAVGSLQNCTIGDLLDVFASAVMDTAVGPADSAGGTLWQWAQIPDVSDSLEKWNEWSVAQLQLPQPASQMLIARFDESFLRHSAKAVINISTSADNQSMRLWWIWQCLLAVIIAAAAAEASVWVGSILKLLRHLLQKTPSDQWELLTNSLFSPNPSVVALLLQSVSKISHGVIFEDNSQQFTSEALATKMIKPRLDFLTFLFEWVRGQRLHEDKWIATLSQCVDLLSSVSSEPAQSLLLTWLVELDYTIGLDERNQARVLEVLCGAVHSSLIAYSRNLFTCFCHFFIALNEAQGKMRTRNRHSGTPFGVDCITDVYDFDLVGIDMVWHLALCWPSNEAIGCHSHSAQWAYHLLITIYKLMPHENSLFSTSHSKPLSKIQHNLSSLLETSTDAETPNEGKLQSLKSAMAWLKLLQGLNAYLQTVQNLPGHLDCIVSSVSEAFMISIDVINVANNLNGNTSDIRSFQVYPETSLGCLRNLVARDVGLIVGDDLVLQASGAALQGNASTMEQLRLTTHSHIVALSHSNTIYDADSVSMSDTIARHGQDCYHTLFSFCGAGFYMQFLPVLETAWSLLMSLPTLERISEELDDPLALQWSRKIGGWPSDGSELIGWVSTVKTVYLVQVVAAYISPADVSRQPSCEQWLERFVDSQGLPEICQFFCSIPIAQTFQHNVIMNAALGAVTAVLHAVCSQSTVAFEQTQVTWPELPSLTQQLVHCLQKRASTPDLIPPFVCVDVLNILYSFTIASQDARDSAASQWPEYLCALLFTDSAKCECVVQLLARDANERIQQRTTHLLLKLCQVVPDKSIALVLCIIQQAIDTASYNTDKLNYCMQLAEDFVKLQYVTSNCCAPLVSSTVRKLQHVPVDVSNEMVVQQCFELLELIVADVRKSLEHTDCNQHFVDEIWEDFMYAFPSDTHPTRRSKVFYPQTQYLASKLVATVQRTISLEENNVSHLVARIQDLHLDLPVIDSSVWKELNVDSQPRDPKRSKHVGLVNQGSTCYQNAVLQQLVMMPDVVDHVLSLRLPEESQSPVIVLLDDDESGSAPGSKDKDTTNQAMHLLWQLQLTWGFCLHSFSRWYDPVPFVDACASVLKLAHPVRHQNDASEFFHALLDTLSRALADTESAGLLEKSFCGERASRLTAVIDGEKRFGPEKTDAFTVLELEVKGNRNVQMALADVVKEEYLSEVIWDGHSEPADSVKETYLKECPPHLALYLKRYSFDLKTLQHTRVNDRFEFEDRLDMSVYMQPAQPNAKQTPCWYRLNGVLIQSGSASAGHYYSVIRDRNTGEWLKVDDKTISHFNPKYMGSECFGDALNSPTGAGRSAYMIFYDREESFQSVEQPYLSSNFAHLAPALCKSITVTNKEFLRHVQLCSPAHALQVQTLVDIATCSEIIDSFPTELLEEAVRLGTQYFFNIAVRLKPMHSGGTGDLARWPELFSQTIHRTNKALEIVVGEIDLQCLLLHCPHPNTRHIIRQAVVASIHENSPIDLLRRLVHKLVAIVPTLSVSDVNCSEYINLLDEVLTEHPSSQSYILESGGVPKMVKAILGPEWHSEADCFQIVMPLSEEYAVQLLGMVITITSPPHVLDQPAMDALRMPALFKYMVRLNAVESPSPRTTRMSEDLLQNLLHLDAHKPEMIMQPLVNCLTSVPWIESVAQLIYTVTCTNCLIWPASGQQYDHVDSWFRLLDSFILNEAWPQLRTSLLHLRSKQLEQLRHTGFDIDHFFENVPEFDDGTGTEETEVHGELQDGDTPRTGRADMDKWTVSPCMQQGGLASIHEVADAPEYGDSRGPEEQLYTAALVNLNQQPIKRASSSEDVDSSHPSKRHRGQNVDDSAVTDSSWNLHV